MEFGHVPLLRYRKLKEKVHYSLAEDLSYGYIES